ncbi:SDR family NAD(P)-dependent oxidoreductase [Tsukamurella tyrosinosolvens]|uniref:SDR family NAD(P)-dependent oxidoreductase n=1 Tax=Tsukamurella tyrosinosolvens TaxID=57704 RepID=UPI000798C3F2|nr:SDR family NAD(P)-dependent oxidoreductase [Tsukamurella tyrosinosolvens]KXP04867.1 3-oxoacyl-ACP reductase [Tsukamurella tyrosinosolvens]
MNGFHDKVAIVTGAGGGLGRAHALALAERGAKVVVNDLGGAQTVVDEILEAGGTAIADATDIADRAAVDTMVTAAVERWRRIDILVNNAGILRDKSFAKMDLADFRKVVDVHLMGSVHCTKAVWGHMIEQGYGRILMTTSASGIYGNFGQANYGAAKSALVGLTNVLAIEGIRKGIRVNALAPTAATQMTDGLIDAESAAKLGPETIAPGAVFLVSDDAPTGVVLGAGAGVFAISKMVEGPAIHLSGGGSPEEIAARWNELDDFGDLRVHASAFAQTDHYVRIADAVSPARP